MMLPYRAKLCLYRLSILKLAHLLKLVNADYNMAVFTLGYYLNHIQYFFWAMCFRSNPERHTDIRGWIYREVDFGCEPCQKVLGFVHPQLCFRGCLF